jgi:hypothetical protein
MKVHEKHGRSFPEDPFVSRGRKAKNAGPATPANYLPSGRL